MENIRPQTQSLYQSPRLPITKHQTSIDARYHILQSRSPSASDIFIYGVRSTKIYCVPTCTARLARRANVVFFNTAQEARRDGFRPCKRCRPDESGFRGKAEEVVGRAISLATMRGCDDVVEVGNGRRDTIGVSDLARELGVSPSYLSRVFKRVMGVTVGEYLVEFEREGAGSVGMETGLPIPGHSPVSSVESEDIHEASDFADFDLDEWFWTGEYLHGTRDVQTV
ncbi:hypothetical protein BJX68DRAFT_91524 [Aspergillus pseudodeflectus]|uniref:HTH araC/xylS-type domain-containing protein n=1 Tax=Aspergillus pseudodeflectus TaxID=176178 RepID=A0ABR4KE28_9EURO